MRTTLMSRVRRPGLLAVGLLVAVAALAGCRGEQEPRELVLLTHNSFNAPTELIERFEQEHNARVTIVEAGDANTVVNRAILSAGNPEGDVLFGIDNLTFKRAEAAGVFVEFSARRRGEIPQDIRDEFGDSTLVTPVDYGYVNINADRKAGAPPSTFEELLEPAWRGRLVVQDPATSSPGLQFLVSTIAHFGEGGWQEFWRGLRANDVLVVDGWDEAYFTHFSIYDGDRPLVVSYTTSPAAEVFFSEGRLTEPPTLNVIPNGVLFRQVEAAGVLRGARNPELARAFIDFLLSEDFQASIPENMFVYPVTAAPDPGEWWRWAQVDVQPARISVTAEEIERWVEQWTAIMRR